MIGLHQPIVNVSRLQKPMASFGRQTLTMREMIKLVKKRLFLPGYNSEQRDNHNPL